VRERFSKKGRRWLTDRQTDRQTGQTGSARPLVNRVKFARRTHFGTQSSSSAFSVAWGLPRVALEVRLLVRRGLGARLRVPASLWLAYASLKMVPARVAVSVSWGPCANVTVRGGFSVDNQEPTEVLIYPTTRGCRLNYQPVGADYLGEFCKFLWGRW